MGEKDVFGEEEFKELIQDVFNDDQLAREDGSTDVKLVQIQESIGRVQLKTRFYTMTCVNHEGGSVLRIKIADLLSRVLVYPSTRKIVMNSIDQKIKLHTETHKKNFGTIAQYHQYLLREEKECENGGSPYLKNSPRQHPQKSQRIPNKSQKYNTLSELKSSSNQSEIQIPQTNSVYTSTSHSHNIKLNKQPFECSLSCHIRSKNTSPRLQSGIEQNRSLKEKSTDRMNADLQNNIFTMCKSQQLKWQERDRQNSKQSKKQNYNTINIQEKSLNSNRDPLKYQLSSRGNNSVLVKRKTISSITSKMDKLGYKGIQTRASNEIHNSSSSLDNYPLEMNQNEVNCTKTKNSPFQYPVLITQQCLSKQDMSTDQCSMISQQQHRTSPEQHHICPKTHEEISAPSLQKIRDRSNLKPFRNLKKYFNVLDHPNSSPVIAQMIKQSSVIFQSYPKRNASVFQSKDSTIYGCYNPKKRTVSTENKDTFLLSQSFDRQNRQFSHNNDGFKWMRTDINENSSFSISESFPLVPELNKASARKYFRQSDQFPKNYNRIDNPKRFLQITD